jgi:hypothetical protein
MSGHAILPGVVKGYPLASYRSEPFPTPCWHDRFERFAD